MSSTRRVFSARIHTNYHYGRYLMHNVMRSALGQGQGDADYTTDQVPPEIKAYLDLKVFPTPEPTSSLMVFLAIGSIMFRRNRPHCRR